MGDQGVPLSEIRSASTLGPNFLVPQLRTLMRFVRPSAACNRTVLLSQVLDLIKHGQIGLRCDDELGPQTATACPQP